MANNDQQLAYILGEPPRKRRAAALAAQKNWQMLSAPEEVGADDDFLEITQIIKNTSNVQKVAQTSNLITPSGKGSSLPNTPTIIEHLNRKRTPIAVDKDYAPFRETFRVTPNRNARKTIAAPLQTRTPVILVQNANRVKGQETVLIETDTNKRVIIRTDGSNYRKPPVVKLAAGEPIDKPIVEGEEEVIVGTYEDDLLNDENDFEDTVEELSLVLFCESEKNSKKELKDVNENNDCIEVISDDKNSQKITNKPKITPTGVHRRPNPRLQKTTIEPIECLEMECENLDDEFTDALTIDCEEDILTESQWNQLMDKKKDYQNYAKSVTSTKNVKFLAENEVTESVGVVTTTISETTRVVTTPSQTTRVTTRPRYQSTTIQSVRAPIPSVGNRISIQRLQRPITTTITPQMSTPNRMPFTMMTLPMTTSAGVTKPLIISPNITQNIVNPTIGSNVRFILQTSQPGSNQPTYVMLPSSTVANGLTPQNIMISNVLTPTTNRNYHLTNALMTRPRILTPTAIRSVPPTATRFVTPNTLRAPFTSTGVRPVMTVRPRMQTYSNVNQIQINRNPSSNELFDCLTVFKGTQNPSKKITMKTVLTIKPLPFSWPSNIDDLINSLIKLDNALMKEKFKESPIAWMVSANLIVPPKCKACLVGICNQVNKALNTKNEYWNCNNAKCKRSFLIDRPRLFAGTKFDIPVSKLLFLIYYWSIQVDVEDLIKTGQIEMGTDKIFNVWTQLQKVCAFALQTKDAKLGPTVEVCSIQVGRYHVVGAMERSTHRTKLAVIPIHEIIQKNGSQAVMLPFIKWLSKSCNIVTCEPKFQALTQYGYRVTVQSKNEFLAQNKNLSLTTISGYLVHHLQRFFKEMDLSTLTNDILSNILDELLWRERYGNNPFTAFYNIVKHISEQCGLSKPNYNVSIVQTNIPTGIRTPPAINQRATKSMAPPPTQSRPVVPELNETNSVFVDEYYYSALTLKTSIAKTISQEESTKDSIQCHLCQMFFDNILIVKHLLEHLEKERRGRVRKGDNNEPECKHCLRFFSNRALHLHEELANLKQIPFSCRICLQPMLARQPFISHMKTTHFSGEMPYYCDICSFRSSFEKSLFDHFQSSHSNSSQVMCLFCIRVFDVTKFKNFSSFLYRHLTTHYAVASVYDCDKCVLTFTSKVDLKDHSFKGHNPSNAVDEKFDVTPYKVQEQETSLCTRAREEELFTPFLPNFDNNPDFGETSGNNVSVPQNEGMNFEISCEPNIMDFLSMEPDIQIDLTDGSSSMADFIFPVDCDYTNDRLKDILTKSFDTSLPKDKSLHTSLSEAIEGVEPNPNCEPIPEPNPEPEKDYILSNNQKVVCVECKTEITTDHFISRKECEKCNFTSHCKTSYEEHTTTAHLEDSLNQNKQSSVLKCFSQLVYYKNICKECDFVSTDGNQLALHMIQSNHFDILCKPLEFEAQSLSTESVPLITTELGPLITDEALPVVTTEAVPLITTEALPVITTESLPLITTESVPLITTEAVPLMSTNEQ